MHEIDVLLFDKISMPKIEKDVLIKTLVLKKAPIERKFSSKQATSRRLILRKPSHSKLGNLLAHALLLKLAKINEKNENVSYCC